MHLPRQQVKRFEVSEINSQLHEISDDMADDMMRLEEMYLDEVNDSYLDCIIDLHFL